MEDTKILIIEDNIIIAAGISMDLTDLGYEVTGILPRGENALTTYTDNPADIILADINLKGEMDGIATVQMIQEKYPHIGVIFLTASSDETTYNRAKHTKPHAFISKPFEQLDLVRAIDLTVLRLQEERLVGEPSPNVTKNASEGDYILDDRIFVKHRDQVVKIYIREILYVEADRSYCKVYTVNKQYIMTLSLKAFEQKLSARNFLRVHRSYIVNLTKIDALSDNYEYVKVGNEQISVSRGFKDELMKRLRLI